jgi:hypothetical protein
MMGSSSLKYDVILKSHRVPILWGLRKKSVLYFYGSVTWHELHSSATERSRGLHLNTIYGSAFWFRSFREDPQTTYFLHWPVLVDADAYPCTFVLSVFDATRGRINNNGSSCKGEQGGRDFQRLYYSQTRWTFRTESVQWRNGSIINIYRESYPYARLYALYYL